MNITDFETFRDWVENGTMPPGQREYLRYVIQTLLCAREVCVASEGQESWPIELWELDTILDLIGVEKRDPR